MQLTSDVKHSQSRYTFDIAVKMVLVLLDYFGRRRLITDILVTVMVRLTNAGSLCNYADLYS